MSRIALLFLGACVSVHAFNLDSLKKYGQQAFQAAQKSGALNVAQQALQSGGMAAINTYAQGGNAQQAFGAFGGNALSSAQQNFGQQSLLTENTEIAGINVGSLAQNGLSQVSGYVQEDVLSSQVNTSMQAFNTTSYATPQQKQIIQSLYSKKQYQPIVTIIQGMQSLYSRVSALSAQQQSQNSQSLSQIQNALNQVTEASFLTTVQQALMMLDTIAPVSTPSGPDLTDLKSGNIAGALSANKGFLISQGLNQDSTFSDATAAKNSLLQSYQTNITALAAINPAWKTEIEQVYGFLSNYSTNPSADLQPQIPNYVTKANNIVKLATLIIKMKGVVKPNDQLWNTVTDGKSSYNTKNLINYDALPAALSALTTSINEFHDVLMTLPLYTAISFSQSTLTKYIQTPSLDPTINTQLQNVVATAFNQATAIPTILASLASSDPLSPADTQWSALVSKSGKKYSPNGSEPSQNPTADQLKTIQSSGLVDFLKVNQAQLTTLVVNEAFGPTKAQQEPLLTNGLKNVLQQFNTMGSSLSSDDLSKLGSLTNSPEIYSQLLNIFSANLHLTSPLQLLNLTNLIKIGQTIAAVVPVMVKSGWTILPGDALWSFFVDTQGKRYTLTELLNNPNLQSAVVSKVDQSLGIPQQTTSTTVILTQANISAAQSALSQAYTTNVLQLNKLNTQWGAAVQQTQTQLNTPSSVSTSVLTTAQNMIKAIPLLIQANGNASPGDLQWSYLQGNDGVKYSLEGMPLS